MNLIYKLHLLITAFLLFLFLSTSQTEAEIPTTISPNLVDENTATVTITFSGVPSGQYKVCERNDLNVQNTCEGENVTVPSINNQVTVTACAKSPDELKFAPNCTDSDYFHARGPNDVYKAFLFQDCHNCETLATARFDVVHVFPNPPTFSTTSPTPNDQITITLTGPLKRPSNSADHDNHCDRNDYEIIIRDDNGNTIDNGNHEITLSPDCDEEFQSTTFSPLIAGSYTLEINDKGSDFVYGTVDFTVAVEGGTIGEFVEDPENEDSSDGGRPVEGRNPCEGGICKTALGDISTDIGAFASQFLSIAIGLAGGIALIILVIGSIRVLTSSGDQQRLAGGRDMIIAAVAGLLFLIFSTLILRFIGVSILGGII